MLSPPVDLASVSTTNDLVIQIAFASRSLRRFVSALRLLRQSNANALIKIMAATDTEIAMPLLAAGERVVVWGAGIVTKVGAAVVLGLGDGD